mmetsp:Transcript_111778/g.176101  ORF Transcript_111778/g.176101 Transcript_111778/m.176101 type:complete len:244 (-) Transcript_111778:619-1350(-)
MIALPSSLSLEFSPSPFFLLFFFFLEPSEPSLSELLLLLLPSRDLDPLRSSPSFGSSGSATGLGGGSSSCPSSLYMRSRAQSLPNSGWRLRSMKTVITLIGIGVEKSVGNAFSTQCCCHSAFQAASVRMPRLSIRSMSCKLFQSIFRLTNLAPDSLDAAGVIKSCSNGLAMFAPPTSDLRDSPFCVLAIGASKPKLCSFFAATSAAFGTPGRGAAGGGDATERFGSSSSTAGASTSGDTAGAA